MLLIYVVCLFLLVIYSKKIRSNPSIYAAIRWLLLTLLISSEIIYQIWTSIHEIWMDNLPFHLCGVAGIVGAVALVTLKKEWIAITFFIALIPALLALLTPDLLYDFPNFRYFKFFIHHIAISLTAVFLAVTSRPGTITFKTMLTTYLLLVGYALFVGIIINPQLNANYLYLSRPPAIASPLDWFGSGIWYRLNLGLITFIVFYLQLITYQAMERKVHVRERGGGS